MKDMSSFFTIGRLVKDPELKYSAKGVPIVTFTIACNSPKKQQDGTYKDNANFFNVVAFNQTAVNCDKYLKKGSQVFVQGEIEQSKWSEKINEERTVTHIRYKIICNSIQFLGSPNKSKENTQNTGNAFKHPEQNHPNPWENNSTYDEKAYDGNDDDIPF